MKVTCTGREKGDRDIPSSPARDRDVRAFVRGLCPSGRLCQMQMFAEAG